MPTMLTVKAAPGLKVPREDKPTAYIDDATAVQVADSPYYRRRIAAGDLEPVDASDPVDAPAPVAPAEAKPGKKPKE